MSSYAISEYFNRIPVFPGAALSDDGTKLAYISSITGSPQVWIGAVEEKASLLSYPKPLTREKEEQPHVMQNSLMWIDNDRLAVLMDRHGDEMTFIKIFNLKDGSFAAVPEVKGARDSLGFVSDDGKTLYFGSNRGHLEKRGLYAFDLKSAKVRALHVPAAGTTEWVPKKSVRGHLLFFALKSVHGNTLHGVHPKTGKVIDLFTGDETSVFPVSVEKDGRLLVVSNFGRQFQGLAYLDLDDQSFEFLEKDQWDVEDAKLSPDKKTLLVSRNVAGRTQLDLFRYPSMKKEKIKLPTKGIVENLSFAKNGRFAVYGSISPTLPCDLYRLDLRTRESKQLTDNWTSRIPKSEYSEPQSIRYESNGLKIQSWFYLPKKAKREGKLPVIIWPHGGPQWQERATLRPIFQYFVGRGFAIWAPNPRGSTGFGKDFVKAIAGQWGTADLPDMENGIAWLKNSGWIDPKKIAIMGGSYGGYMTLRSITKIPKTFRAAVDIFGVSNLITFVKSVPADWAPYMDELVGNPEKDAARLRDQSPINALANVDCPLMVIQGALDPRVVKAESDQVVEQLKKLGKPVEYIVFDDEGHGFLKPGKRVQSHVGCRRLSRIISPSLTG